MLRVPARAFFAKRRKIGIFYCTERRRNRRPASGCLAALASSAKGCHDGNRIARSKHDDFDFFSRFLAAQEPREVVQTLHLVAGEANDEVALTKTRQCRRAALG